MPALARHTLVVPPKQQFFVCHRKKLSLPVIFQARILRARRLFATLAAPNGFSPARRAIKLTFGHYNWVIPADTLILCTFEEEKDSHRNFSDAKKGQQRGSDRQLRKKTIEHWIWQPEGRRKFRLSDRSYVRHIFLLYPNTESLRSRFLPSSSDVGSRVVFFLHLPARRKSIKVFRMRAKLNISTRENVSFSPLFHASGPSASEFLIFLLLLALRSFSGSAPTHARTFPERERERKRERERGRDCRSMAKTYRLSCSSIVS